MNGPPPSAAGPSRPQPELPAQESLPEQPTRQIQIPTNVAFTPTLTEPIFNTANASQPAAHHQTYYGYATNQPWQSRWSMSAYPYAVSAPATYAQNAQQQPYQYNYPMYRSNPQG